MSTSTKPIPTASATIDLENPAFTVLTLFEVPDEESQHRLLTYLEHTSLQIMRHQPGFRSASFHRGIPFSPLFHQRFVANYAQWESEDAFRAVLANDKARVHMREIENEFRRVGGCFVPITVIRP